MYRSVRVKLMLMCTAEAEDRRLKPAKKQREARSYQHGRKVRVVLPTSSRTAQGAWRCCCSVGAYNVHIRIVPSYILLGNMYAKVNVNLVHVKRFKLTSNELRLSLTNNLLL